MKKIGLFILFVLFTLSAFAAPILSGIGNPYGVVPSAIGQLYLNKTDHATWKATSLKADGWVKLEAPAGNGTADAPFQMLKLESAVFAPIVSPATPTLNMLFVASGTNALTFGVASGASTVWKIITPQ